ncbi:hypothetical protein [Lentzea xinjiangensis]|uniref:hypothetical protein n=1 Tax=Lentzea xinjiangensis TaxID=402600 RepID=UPI001FE5DB20|nr:hypothetical protein [Lentzea xinjiangensis]
MPTTTGRPRGLLDQGVRRPVAGEGAVHGHVRVLARAGGQQPVFRRLDGSEVRRGQPTLPRGFRGEVPPRAHRVQGRTAHRGRLEGERQGGVAGGEPSRPTTTDAAR